MKVMYLKDLDLRAGFGYGAEKRQFNQRCIGICDAFTFELHKKLNLEARYPRLVMSFHSTQALEAPRAIYFEGSKKLDLPRFAELELVAAPDLFSESTREFR